MKVIIAGGGWAGCSAAWFARNQGLDVALLERTDQLLGTGLVGGIVRNNGRFTATEELIALGGADFFSLIDSNLKHSNLSFPDHEHASLYDITKVPVAVYNALLAHGVQVHLRSRISKITISLNQITSVQCDDHDRTTYEGDAYVDTTGTCGPGRSCQANGNGCAMCIMRCPSFGPRASLVSLAGLPEYSGLRPDGRAGSFSGACKILKESLSAELIHTLDTEGVAVIPIPKELQENHLTEKACQQYACQPYVQNLVLLDTGHAKLMTPFYPLEKLHRIPGFEYARYEDPYAASIGNSIRFTACSYRDDTLKVPGIGNLFVAGEKAGLLVGHTEAITTGALAGYNAAQFLQHHPLLVLPRSLCIGDLIAYSGEMSTSEAGRSKKYSFSGSIYFARMKQLGLYTTDVSVIKERVAHAGLTDRLRKTTT